MKVEFSNDKAIVSAIKAGGEVRNRALTFIFSNPGFRKRISNFVTYHKGSEEDVHDVMVEAIIIFDRNIRYNKFESKSSLMTYAYSIAKWFWINKMKEDRRVSELKEKIKEETVDIKNPELIFMESELKKCFESILQQLSEKCKAILKYWSLSYSYKEIAEELKVDNHNSIRKQKLYCQRKLALYLKENPTLIPGIYNGRD